jgi:WD40 repeat protein
MAETSVKQLGKYKIEKLLGRGGMGSVYKAFQPELERDVAIKTIHPYLVSDSHALERFQREAKIVAKLRHPAIVQVHDFDVENNTCYMVMEFVPGETLENRLQAIHAKGERLPLNEALRLFQAITRAVAYAHAQGIAHQDLKPANVLLTEQGQPVLADFGLSRIVGIDRLDTPGTISGTPQYMSPEQCSGQVGDMRSDVYSLGVMLYELTTSTLPFTGKSAVGLILKHISETPPPPRLLNPDLPLAIEEVIQKTLEKAPADRYPSAQELLEAVEDIVAPVFMLDEEGGLPLDERCPYRGLAAFEEEHAEFYFGREALVSQLLEKLKQTLSAAARSTEVRASRFLTVLGASGSGKSSLAQAGLIPALRTGALPGSAEWVIRVMKPGSQPLEELATQVAVTLGGEDRLEARKRLLNQLTSDGRTLHLVIRAAWWQAPPEQRLLLVVDQFEEVFTLCHDEARRQSFIENLLYAAAVDTGRVIVLLTMRADFYHRCAAYPELAGRVSAQQLLVGPMSEDELRRAIEQPARHVGLRFETGLVDAILADVAQQPGALPLLQHALLELWEGRYGRLLMLRAYQASGGVSGAIAQRADTLYDSLNPEEQIIVRRVMLRLTQPGEGTEDTRRRARRSELLLGAAGSGPDDNQIHAETVESVLQKLADARLITTMRDADTATEYVDVAHEALIRGWTRLREWIDRDRESLRTHRRLTEAAAEWERYSQDESYLYRGARLAEAEEWAEAHRNDLNLLEHQFLQASMALRDQELLAAEAQRQRELEQAQALAEAEHQRAETQARATRRLRRFALALAIVFLVAVGAAIFAWIQQRRAETNEQLAQEQATVALAAEEKAEARRAEAEAAQAEAEHSARNAQAGRLAAQAQAAFLEGYPQRSLLLAAEALNVNLQAGEPRLPAAENTLRQILTSSGGRSLIGQDDLLTAMAVSPDNRWLVTASGPTARLWNISTDSSAENPALVPIILTGHQASITTVAISPTPFGDDPANRWLVTGDESGLVRLWDVSTLLNTDEGGVAPASITLTGHNGLITTMAVSPDNRWLATGSADTTVRLWDVSTLLDPGLSQDEGTGISTLLKADLTKANVSTATTSATVPSIVLTNHQAPVTAMAINPAPFEDSTGKYWLATGDEKGLAYLWNVSAMLDRGLITSSASGSTAASAVLTGHQAAITTIAISPDNRWLVTGSDDATTRLWDVSTLLDTGVSMEFTLSKAEGLDPGLSVSPRSTRGRNEGTDVSSLFDSGLNRDEGTSLTTSAPATTTSIVLPSQSFITALAISPGGRWLVTASWDDTARLWDVSTLLDTSVSTEFTLSKAEGLDPGLSVSSRSTRGQDEDTHLTASDPTNTPIILRGHDKPIFTVAFSPDEHWLVTGSGDHTARLWDLTAPDPAAASIALRGHEAGIIALSISSAPPEEGAANQWLITGSNDATIRQWDLRHAPDSIAATPIILRGQADSSLTAIAISPDYRWLAAGTDGDNTVNLWDVSTEFTLSKAEGLNPSASGTLDTAIDPIILTGHQAAITAIAISSASSEDDISDRWLATGDRSGAVYLWDVSVLLDSDLRGTSETTVTPIILTGHQAAITTIAISPDHRWLVTGSDDTTIRLWDLQNVSDLTATPIVLTDHEGAITSMVISPDGHWLVTGSGDHTVRLWRLTAPNPAERSILLRSHEGAITTMAISSNGRWLVTGSSDNTARLWDVSVILDTGVSTQVATPITLQGHEGKILALAISPDNRWLVTASGDNTARLWDLPGIADTSPAGSSITTSIVLRGHDRPILAVALSPAPSDDSPDNYWLVTAGGDSTARLWDLRDTPDPTIDPIILRGHEGPIFAAMINPGNYWLVTASNDNTVRLWPLQPEALIELACHTAGRNFTQAEWRQFFADEAQAYRQTCPQLPVHRSAIGEVLDRTATLIQTGDLQAAAEAYAQLVAWTDETPDAYLNSLVCWHGSLDGLAEIVLPACDHAVQLAPGDGTLRDNRGVARALTGDFAGAIEDFEYFVAWSKGNELYEQYGRRREVWISELEAGRNPFDAVLLKALRTE